MDSIYEGQDRPVVRCHIELLGGLKLQFGSFADGKVISQFPTRKAAAVLARLAYGLDRVHLREELLDLFWPQMAEDRARNNLRQTLCSLRRLLASDAATSGILLSDKSAVRLDPLATQTDVEELESALNAARQTNAPRCLDAILRALDLYRGELLPEFLDEWILPERRRLESLYLNAVRDCAALAAESDDPRRALPHALRAIAIDPLDEDGHLAAIRLHAAARDTGAVRRAFRDMERALRDGLGELPRPATRQAVEQLEAAAEAGAGANRRPAPAGQPNAAEFTRLARSSDAAATSAEITRNSEIETLQSHRPTRFDSIVAHERHAAICLALGERAWEKWYGPAEEEWLRRFTAANDDLRAALRWLLDNDPDRAVQFSGALTRFWYVRGFPREGYRWLSESLARATSRRTIHGARALVGASWLAPARDSRSEVQCREAIAICQECGDDWGVAHALRHLGLLANCRWDGEAAVRYFQQALDVFAQLNDVRGQAVTLLSMSFAVPDPARRAFSERRKLRSATRSLLLFRQIGNAWGISMALFSLGELAARQHHSERVEALIGEALDTAPESNGLTTSELVWRGMLSAAKGDLAAVRASWKRALLVARDQGDRQTVSTLLAEFILLPDNSDRVRARLLGGVMALDGSLGVDTDRRWLAIHTTLRDRMGAAAFEPAYAEGLGWSWERMVDEAADST